MPEQHLQRRVDERNTARRRQKTLTRLVAVAATALAGGFAGLSAQKATARKSATTESTAATTTRATSIPAAPSLGAAPAAPAQAPVATSSPPVAASGGS